MSIEGRTERVKKEDPRESRHTCPHRGIARTPAGLQLMACGDEGWLCDMCKRDAAMERVNVNAAYRRAALDKLGSRLVEGLAMALLSSHGDAPLSSITEVIAALRRETARGKEEGGSG